MTRDTGKSLRRAETALRAARLGAAYAAALTIKLRECAGRVGSPADLSRICGVSDQCVGHWLSGRAMPSPGPMLLLARQLNVDYRDLIPNSVDVARHFEADDRHLTQDAPGRAAVAP